MPGPVSDSYDPEFGTGARASEVREAITKLRDLVANRIGSDVLQDIVDLSERYNATQSPEVDQKPWPFSERELRIIRFCMNRALESI
jgi:hypothetical protein